MEHASSFQFLGQTALIFLAVVIGSFLLLLGIGYALYNAQRKQDRRTQENDQPAQESQKTVDK